MSANTWVDHLRKLIQSKDICQLRRTGLRTHFEWTPGHTVPRKEAPCPPNTNFHHLPYAGFSTSVNQSQFSASSVSWPSLKAHEQCCNRMWDNIRVGLLPLPTQTYVVVTVSPKKHPEIWTRKGSLVISAKTVVCFTRMVCMNLHY